MFRLNKEMKKLILVFSSNSFDNYRQEPCNKQVIRPRFKDKSSMQLKCKSTPVKVGL